MAEYVILGIVQGLTEFLPVSSSAHLVILERLFGITENQVAITVILHLGTAFSLVAFFWKDLLRLFKDFRLAAKLLLTTIITVIIALVGRDFFESLFTAVTPVALALATTGIMLILTKRFTSGRRKDIGFVDAAILGLAQSIAIVPGISRSGATISTLLFRGVDKQESFRYSFLAAIPVIFGAAILEARKIDFAAKSQMPALILGFLVSFVTGIIALIFLRKILNKAKLYYLGYYCIIVAVLTLLFIR